MSTVYGNTITNISSSSGTKVVWRAYITYSLIEQETYMTVRIEEAGIEILSGTNFTGNWYFAADSTTCSLTDFDDITWPSSKKYFYSTGNYGIRNCSISKAKRESAYTYQITFKLVRTSGNWVGTSTAQATITFPPLKKFHIIYYSNGGSGAARAYDVYYDQNHTIKSADSVGISRTGYTFAGWATSSTSTTVAYKAGAVLAHVQVNKALYAVWTKNSYVLTANANNGTISTTSGWSGNSTIATKTIPYQDAYGSFPTISRSNYNLLGWYTASSGGSKVSTETKMEASNTDIYAQWQGNDITLTLDNQSAGTAGTTAIYTRYATGVYRDSSHSTVMSTSSNPITIPVKTGYTFGGYWTSTNGGGTQRINANGYITSNLTSTTYTTKATLYAKWTEKTATLSYNNTGSLSGATVPSNVEMKYTTATTLTAGTAPSGYSFSGWATSDTNAKAGTRTYTGTQQLKAANVVPSNTPLYAVWYSTLSYNANGHGTAPSSQTMYFTNATNTAALPIATGYTCTKWNTSANGGGTNYNANVAIKSANTYKANTILYAQWTANTYTITLNNQSATSAGTGAYYEKYNTGIYSNSGCTSTFTNNKISVPSRTGYTFGGYYTGANGGGTKCINADGTIVAANTAFTAPTTLYALWTPNIYTITLDNQSATTAGTTAYYEKYNTGNYTTNACTTTITNITKPTYTNHSFGGYYTGANGSGTQWINASGAITATKTTFTANTTLKAKWIGDKSAPNFPSGKKPLIQRCVANGDLEDSGKYCKITFTVNPGNTYSDTAATKTIGPASVVITYKERGGSGNPIQIKDSVGSITQDNTPISFVVTDTNNNLIQFNESKIYDFTLTFKNTTNNLTTVIADYLSAAYFPMDFNKTATALGIFRTAPDDNEGLYVGKQAFIENKLFVGSTSTTAKPTGSIYVHDLRSYAIPVDMFSSGANFFFSNNTMPTGNWWSGLHVNGWTGDYNAWELAGPSAAADQRTTPLYVRSGRTTGGWGSWRQIYDSSNPPTAAAVSALPISGGNLTGNVNLKISSIDGSKADNNVSSTQYPTTFSLLDTGNRILARQEALICADGRIGAYWYIRNYNTDGTQVAQKGIQMVMAKDGTLTYSVSDPAKFTTAISALPLAGGTMSGSIIMNNETSISAKIARKVDGGTGWSYAPYRFTGNDNAMFAQIGAYGSANLLNYTFIGSNNWDGANLRVYPDGSTWTSTLTIQKGTVATNTYVDVNPKILFKNGNDSQSISLTFTDYDSVQAPASLTLNGNQGGEYFIAPNIKATTQFYGTLSGNATNVTGTVAADHGGTGKTNLKDACNALINALDTGTTALTSNDYVITQYVGGGTTTTTYHRRPASALRVGGLLTARKLKVALGSTTDKTFNGTADVTDIPISGTLAVANGGTGATGAAAARANLATPAMVTETYPALLPIDGSNNWIKIGKANDSYGILPSQAGAAGSGHNYIGTSSWYWKYAYIDNIYCTGALQKNGYEYITWETKSLDNQSVSASGSTTMTVTMNKTGYSLVGLGRISFENASSSGSNSTFMQICEFYFNNTGTNTATATVRVRNAGSNAAKVKINVTGIYRAN